MVTSGGTDLVYTAEEVRGQGGDLWGGLTSYIPLRRLEARVVTSGGRLTSFIPLRRLEARVVTSGGTDLVYTTEEVSGQGGDLWWGD